MGYGDMVFLAILALLIGMIWVGWRGKRKRFEQGSGDYGGARPERNDDGQGGGGID
jgi:hypothetical protein